MYRYTYSTKSIVTYAIHRQQQKNDISLQHLHRFTLVRIYNSWNGIISTLWSSLFVCRRIEVSTVAISIFMMSGTSLDIPLPTFIGDLIDQNNDTYLHE